ncbi:hypothetical protein DL769_002377 [Monosporascus sp. CRB-8-3]|nr:hypothetical protein DL769_002377 [Monosporascus sp. CRB-8-3]
MSPMGLSMSLSSREAESSEREAFCSHAQAKLRLSSGRLRLTVAGDPADKFQEDKLPASELSARAPVQDDFQGPVAVMTANQRGLMQGQGVGYANSESKHAMSAGVVAGFGLGIRSSLGLENPWATYS